MGYDIKEGKVGDAWTALDRVEQILRMRDNNDVIAAKQMPRLQHELSWVYSWLTAHTWDPKRREMMGDDWSGGNDREMSGMFVSARQSAVGMKRHLVSKLKHGDEYRWTKETGNYVRHHLSKIKMCEEYLRIMTGELAPRQSKLFNAVDSAWMAPVKAVLLAVELSPVGDFLNLAKAAIHVATGDFEQAGISLAAAIPLLGDAVVVGRFGVKAGRIVEGIGQRMVRIGKKISPVRLQMALAYGKKVYRKAVDRLGELNLDDALEGALDRVRRGSGASRAGGRAGGKAASKGTGAARGGKGSGNKKDKKKKKKKKKGGDPRKKAAAAGAEEAYKKTAKQLQDGVKTPAKLKSKVEGHKGVASKAAKTASGGLAELISVTSKPTPKSNSWGVLAKAKRTKKGKDKGVKAGNKQATHGSRGWIVFAGRKSTVIYLPAKKQGANSVWSRVRCPLRSHPDFPGFGLGCALLACPAEKVGTRLFAVSIGASTVEAGRGLGPWDPGRVRVRRTQKGSSC